MKVAVHIGHPRAPALYLEADERDGVQHVVIGRAELDATQRDVRQRAPELAGEAVRRVWEGLRARRHR